MIRGEIPQLDRAGLRRFGLTTGIIVALLFGLLLPWLFGHGLALWPFMLAALLAGWALLLPDSLAPIYRGWMKVGMVLGFINTHIVLFLLYYVIFVPAGLAMRIFGRDPLVRKITRTRNDSYRVLSKKREHTHFERPY